MRLDVVLVKKMKILILVTVCVVMANGCSKSSAPEQPAAERGLIRTTEERFRASVSHGMSTREVLAMYGRPLLHFGPEGVLARRTNETGVIGVPIIWWEYKLAPSGKRMAVMFSTNCVVESVTDDVVPEPMSI